MNAVSGTEPTHFGTSGAAQGSTSVGKFFQKGGRGQRWLRTLWGTKKTASSQVNSYEAYVTLIASETGCGCGGTCVGCKHIAKDTFRPEFIQA